MLALSSGAFNESPSLYTLLTFFVLLAKLQLLLFLSILLRFSLDLLHGLPLLSLLYLLCRHGWHCPSVGVLRVAMNAMVSNGTCTPGDTGRSPLLESALLPLPTCSSGCLQVPEVSGMWDSGQQAAGDRKRENT